MEAVVVKLFCKSDRILCKNPMKFWGDKNERKAKGQVKFELFANKNNSKLQNREPPLKGYPASFHFQICYRTPNGSFWEENLRYVCLPNKSFQQKGNFSLRSFSPWQFPGENFFCKNRKIGEDFFKNRKCVRNQILQKLRDEFNGWELVRIAFTELYKPLDKFLNLDKTESSIGVFWNLIS